MHRTATTPIRILAIEDAPVFVRSLRATLHSGLQSGSTIYFSLQNELSLTAGLEQLQHREFDVVLLDLHLPDSVGLATFRAVHEAAPHLPIVVLTSTDDEMLALDALRQGAQDYLVKGLFDPRILSHVIRYSIERNRTKQELRESESRARRLQGEVIQISEHEQQRIGRDLHDGVGQQLTGVNYLSASLARRLEALGLPEAQLARQIVEAARDALRDLRLAIRGLAPVDMDAEGLAVALEQLAATTRERFGAECRFVSSGRSSVEDAHTATHLYRIAQESVHNAIKHAEASKVEIRLESDEHRIELEIRDDGCGMPADVEQSDGLGLAVMRYRAGLIDGELEILPDLQRGTVVRCSLKKERTVE